MFKNPHIQSPQSQNKENENHVESTPKPVEVIPRPTDFDVSIGKLRNA